MPPLNIDFIEKFSDQASLAEDKAFIVAQLKEIYTEYKKVANLRISIDGATSTSKLVKDAKDLEAGYNGMSVAVNNLKNNVVSMNTAQKDLSAAISKGDEDYSKTGVLVSELAVAEANAAQEAIAWAAAMRQTAVAAEANVVALTGSAVALAENRLALQSNLSAQKTLKDLMSDKGGTQSQINQLSLLVDKEIELKTAIAASTAELRLQNQLEASIPGTKGNLTLSNKALALERDNTQDPGRIAEINAQMDRNNKLIEEQSNKLEKQKINIGNYSASFKKALDVVEKELKEVNTLLAANPNNSGLIAQQSALKNALAVTGKEFGTTTAQAAAFKQASVQLGQSLGVNNTVFKEFTKNVADGTQGLKQTNVVVDQTIKGGEGIGKAFRGAYSILRQTAYILPAIGISGIILLITKGVEALAEAIGIFNPRLSEADAKLKIFNTTLEGAESGYVKARLEVSNLRVAFDQAKEGIITKEEALKLYNDTMGKTTGAVKTLEEAEDEYVKKAEVYIKFMLLKAAAQYALQEAAKKAYDGIKLRSKEDKEFTGFFDQIGGIFGQKNEIGTQAAADEFKKKVENAGKKKKEIQIKQAAEDQKQNEDIAKSLFDQANELAKTYNLDYNAIRPPKAGAGASSRAKAVTDEASQILAAYEAQRQALLKARQLEIQDQADSQKTIFDSNKFSLDERLQAIEVYSKLKQKLIDNDLKEEIAKIDSQEKVALTKAKDPKLKTQIELSAKAQRDLAILKSESELSKSRIEIDNKTTAVLKENSEYIDKAYEDLYANLSKNIDKSAKSSLVRRSEEQMEELNGIELRFQRGGFKNTEEYERRREAVVKEYARNEIDIQIATEEERLALATSFQKDTTYIEAKIIELKKKGYELDTKNFLTENEKKEKAEKELRDKKIQLARAGVNLFESIVQGQYDREKNEIQLAKDEVDKKKEAELLANEAIVQSTADRAANIAIINQRAAQQKEILDRRAREVDYKKAQFDRIISIAEVAANTAKAISFDLIKNKALIPFDIAIGAAQIAAILARPLPRFKHGLFHDYEGLAYTGDGGRSEVHQKADGSFSITPDTPTVTKIERGDRVYPSIENFIQKAMRIKDGESILRQLNQGPSFEDKNIVKELRGVRKAIGSNRGSFDPSFSSLASFQNYVNSYNQYRNSQTQY